MECGSSVFGISIDDFYLAPEYSTRFTSEKTCVFSLAATVWSTADWRLTEAEKPSLSLGFQELLVSMTDDDPDARPSLHNVLQTCDSLQTEGDMTSREKCQALLWEYQASAAITKEDVGKRKTLEEEKKQHDTLMGSIAVAASCKGFLKQAPRPQEQNPFVRTQAHREQRNQTDSQLLKEIPANDAFVEVENKSKEIRNNEEDVVKGVSSFAAKNDCRSIACDANNNLTAQNPRYSLTEEQKEQLLSLLASTSLRPDSNSFERRDKEQAGNEPIGLSKTTLEHNKVKPSSPSVYSYPHFPQAEHCGVFDPITPAGRSMSPNMYSNTSESQRSAVPKFVPIAVPVPSVTPVPMSPFWYIPQGGLMPYPQPAMSPVQFVPVDTSMASNQPVISPDSDVSEVFDGEPRTMKASSAFPRPDGTNVGSSLQTDVEQGTRRSPSLRDKKASKLPRPIWQTGTKSRSIPTELEKNPNVSRQRIPTSGQTNTSDNENKRVRARSPSPHIGRRSSADATPSPRSQTPPVNRSTDGVDASAKPKLQKRMSMGSLPNSRPSSPNSPDVFHRSKSRSSSLLQQSGGNTENRTTSSAGSRSNSPVSNRISKRESSSSDISPWTRRNSVSSMITKFGSSSLLNEDRIVKGQLKPNGTASATRKSSKTGPFRQSMISSGRASECPPKGNPVSSHEKPIFGSKKTTTMSFDSDELLFKVESGDQRKMQRNISRSLSNDNKRQDFTAQSRRRLSSSLQSLHKATEAGSDRRLQDSTMRLSKGTKKWSSQDNIVGDIRLNAPQMNESGISFDNALVTAFKVIPDVKDSLNTGPETEFTGKSSSLSFPSKDSSISIGDLRNGVVINTSNSSERGNSSFLTELARRSSLDSEPVREKAAPKPRQSETTQPYDVKGSADFVRSPITSAQKFETQVDLSLLGSTFATFPTQVSSSSQLRGGKEGSTLPLQAQVDSGLFKEFKSSDYFTNVNLKCGEMEPERDTDCFEKPKLRDKEGTECNAGNAKTDDPVMEFDRKVLRGTSGDAKDERSAKDTPLSSSMADKSGENSATQIASSSTETLTTSKTSKIHSAIDPVTASRKHLGENGQFSTERLNASSSRDPRSPLILRKLLSNPLPKGDNVSGPLSASAKRNSLPTPKPGKVSTKPDVSLTCKESSSRSYLLPDQKQTQNNSSEKDILSSTASKKPVLALEKKGEPMEKNNPIYSKLNNPHSKEDDVGTKGPTSTTSYSRNISNSPSSSKEREASQERKPNSSNPYVQPAKTNIEVSDAPQNSASGYIRYPYTRRASTPAKENSTSKLPAKSASNPTLRADLRETQKFFTPPITCLGDSMGSRNPIDSNIDRGNVSQKGVQPDEKTNWRNESNEVGGMPSSSVGSSPMASPSGSVLRVSSTFASPTKATFVDQASSEHNLGDSGVFHAPSFEEHFSKGESISMETTDKPFPSNASSDSGLNICDPEDTQRSNRNPNEHRKQGVQRNPDCTSSPQTPKFLIGSNIFYDPRVDRQSNINFSETRLASMGNEPQNLANMLSSGRPREAAIPSKNTPTDSKHSPNKTVGSDGDKVKNPKGLVLSIQDKKSPDANENTGSHPDKRKGAKTVLNAETIAGILKSTSKEKLSPSTPPPDITGRFSGKSPPSPSSSSNLASKERLGQLVKKVLNTAAAKQGSSPKASFAELSSLTEGEQSKEKQSNKVVVSSSPRHTSEVKGKERSSGKGKITSAENSNQEQRFRESHETPKGKCQVQLPETGSPSNFKETSVTTRDQSQAGISLVQVEDQSCESKEKDALSRIIDLIHDEFAFDGYLDDGVEDVNMAEYVLSLAGMSKENFNEAIRDQYSDLYWDEDLLRAMYQAVACGQETTRSSESTVCDMSPSTSSNLSREESYLSLEPLYLNSISRSSSERSGAGARDVLVSPLGEATEFLPIKVIAPDMQMYIQGLLEPIFEDYHRIMGIKLASSVDDLSDKLGSKIMEISQQLMLERRAKKKSINSYNKTADVENKKDVKELALKLVNEIEESDKKIVYLKRVQWQLRNVYAERFGLDTSLLHSFLVSYNKTCVTLEPELNNSFLNFSPIWNQRMNENNDIVDESFVGPSLQSGTKLGLFSYLFDRHAISQSFVRYFFYTYRYVASSQELFNFIRDKCSASLRTDSSGQVYNHQLQIRYRSLDLMSEWIDGYYQFDFKTNLNLIEELLTFVKDELILVDRSERGHYLLELIAEKQNRDSNNNSLSEETVDSVAVLQMEDPQGLSVMEGKKDSPRKPLGSRKSKSPVQCFRRASTEVETTYKATLYLKALSVLDHSSRVLAEQLTLIQQDLFADVHPVHFLNSRAHGIGVGRNQSPTRERDSIFGFSTGNRRFSEFPAPDQGPLLCGNNLYASEPISDGTLEQVLEHAQDVSLWVAVEICSASSVKGQLALITKFVNAAHYCCEIRNYATCIQIVDALEMFVVRQLPVWKQVPTKTTEILEELKAVKVLLKTDSSWLMRSESSREKPTIPCFLLFVIHVQQQELGGFTLPSDMYKWTKMRCVARLVDQLRLFKQMRYAFQTDEELKDRLKQRIHECKNENLHALASENASNFYLASSHGSRKFHDAFKKMKATFGGFN
ncbi:ras guanine nucleotide exchange factor Y-like isoform X2 [Montipora capricornis]|uniref:ras guanine nucleotide exchange factor Y-like isoform X2 n=1 Tax=Montipora capricornis TaxID=246305 RepID=UPI0035F137CB